jgi:transcriptional regulator with XRE-family HTH domain
MAKRHSAKGADPIRAEIGARIRARRLMLGLTPAALARHARLGTRTVERYEAGALAPSLTVLYRIACALAIPAGDLFEGAGAPSPRNELADMLTPRPGEGAEAALLRALEPFADLPPRVQESMANLIRAVAAAWAGRAKPPPRDE